MGDGTIWPKIVYLGLQLVKHSPQHTAGATKFSKAIIIDWIDKINTRHIMYKNLLSKYPEA